MVTHDYLHGCVCLQSDTSIHTVLSCIYGLLLAPEPHDPLDSRQVATTLHAAFSRNDWSPPHMCLHGRTHRLMLRVVWHASMAEAFFADRAAYDASAKALTEKHAMVSLSQWRVRNH